MEASKDSQILPIGNLPFSQTPGCLTNHTPPPGRTHSRDPSHCPDLWVGPGEECMLAEFRGALLKSSGEPAASGIWSKTERGKRKEKEKLKACSPRRKAHSGGGISAHRRTVPEDTWLLAPRSLGASSSSSSEPGTPPESLLHQTDHMNFKMVPGSRGQERVDRSRRS